jgi:hypothetical protein
MRAFGETVNELPSAKATPSLPSGLDDVAAINEIADLRLTDIGRQIGLSQDDRGVLDANRARNGEHLANRICIGGSTSTLAQGQIHTDAKRK